MRLRSAKEDDAEFLFKLRNEPAVRQSAFQTRPIPWSAHRQWLKRALNDRNTVLLIAERRGKRQGQIRFSVNFPKKEAEVDIALTVESRGRGYGLRLLRRGCRLVFDRMPIHKILAFIKPDNAASLKIFSKAGFIRSSTVRRKKHPCVRMVLDSRGDI